MDYYGYGNYAEDESTKKAQVKENTESEKNGPNHKIRKTQISHSIVPVSVYHIRNLLKM